jgi:hypothetical protein
MKYLYLTIIVIGLHNAMVHSQELKKTDLNGYISVMPSLVWQSTKDTTIFYQQHLIHNRINFFWYPTSALTFSAQMRNQLIYGDFVKMTHYDKGFNTESYLMPLTLYIPFENKYLLYSSLDRLWLKYTYKNLEIKAGRQRINWSQTFTWNPNDIFNTYNFFDFDYEEKPGADALKVQYYTGTTSSLEAAVKVDSSENVTAAVKYKFNKWNYDVQLLAGQYGNTVNKDSIVFNTKDIVTGIGWSGSIKNVSFRGEMTYLYPSKNITDTSGLFYMSIGADYGFQNEAFANAEFFYSDIPDYVNRADFFSFYGGSRSLKSLTPAHYNFFGQFSYPFTPLVKGTLSGMYFFDKKITGIFSGPSLDVSITDTFNATLYFQLFAIKTENPYTLKDMWTVLNFAFFRLKYSF